MENASNTEHKILLSPDFDSNTSSKGSGYAKFNIIILGLNFLALFFAFNTIQVLHSETFMILYLFLIYAQAFETTVNHKNDVGFRSLSALYFAFSISTLFAGFIVRKLGERHARTQYLVSY